MFAEDALEILGLEVVNANSMQIEVKVGIKGMAADRFEVLLPLTSLMTWQDAGKGNNTAGTRSFDSRKLTRRVTSKKWGLVRIEIHQPNSKV